jgi:Zinc carboxypeptidase
MKMLQGSHAFSEPEAKHLAEFIKQIPNLAVYIPFHSYGQILMLPYGWTYELLENYDEVYGICLKAVEKLRSFYGTNYRLGTIANVLCKMQKLL